MGASARERNTFAKPVEELVDGLLAGGPMDEFANLFDNSVKVGEGTAFQSKPPWKYGSSMDRYSLDNLLWQQARSSIGTPERRAAYAKASVLLAAEDFWMGEAYLDLISRQFDVFAKAAQLITSQADQLRASLGHLSAANKQAGAAAFDVIEAEAKIITAAGGAIPEDDVRREIDAIKAQWAALAEAPGWSLPSRFRILGSLRTLRNLAHARNNPTALKLADDLLASWKTEKWPDPMNHWVDDTLSAFGPPPKNTRIGGPGAPGASPAPDTPRD